MIEGPDDHAACSECGGESYIHLKGCTLAGAWNPIIPPTWITVAAWAKVNGLTRERGYQHWDTLPADLKKREFGDFGRKMVLEGTLIPLVRTYQFRKIKPILVPKKASGPGYEGSLAGQVERRHCGGPRMTAEPI